MYGKGPARYRAESWAEMTQLSRSIPFPVRFGLQTHRQKDNCWIWRGAKNRRGYGHICRNGKRIQAHQASWEIHFGPVPRGLWVLHKCDVPSCVNPSHLFVGTPKDNAQDCIRKGRWSYSQLKCELVGTSKLTANDVLTIRERAKSESVKDIASSYGLSKFTVYDILERRTWRHV